MKVTMVNSVDEYVAGEEYDLDEETADRFLILGYAGGSDLSRVYSDEERAAVAEGHQQVNA